MARGKTTQLPRAPRMDRSAEAEHLTRQMFSSAVKDWLKKNPSDDGPVPKDVIGNIVDNLTAAFTPTIETLVDSACSIYLATIDAIEEEEEEEEEED